MHNHDGDNTTFGLHPQRWWSKETTKNKRRMVSEEIHHFEESKRLAIAVAQPKQCAWTRWENPKDRTITWSNIKQMEPKQLGFLIKAVYDILPTPVNLKLWGLSTSYICKACGNLLSFLLRCSTRPYEKGHPMRLELTRVGLLVELANHYTTRGGKIANLKYILTGCQYSPRSYKGRHNEILGIIIEIAKMCCEIANKISCIKTSIQFVKEGNVSKSPHRNRHKPTLLDGCAYWRVIADIDRQLAFPTEIISTRQDPRPHHLVS